MKKKIAAGLIIATLLFQITACKSENASTTNSEKTAQSSSPSVETQSPNPEEKISEKGSIEGQNVNAASKDTQSEIIEAGGWSIEAKDHRIDKSMESVSVVLGYTDVGENTFKQEAQEGYELCLVKMAFEKLDSNEEISWDKFSLIDGEGNKYQRMDDTFISDLGMNRMPGTALNFGSYEGWIAFEVEEGAKDLTLHYEFADDTYEYLLSE